MTSKRKVKRSARRPAARQRAARRRALSKRVPPERMPSDSGINADHATNADVATHFEELMDLCGFIGMRIVARSMCVLEEHWGWVMEDADPDEPLEEVLGELGDDGVLIRAVLGTAMRYQELVAPGDPDEMMSGVLDQLDELHAMVHDARPA